MPFFFTDEESRESKLPAQALAFFGHAGIALGTWALLMLLGYLLNPAGAPQLLILAICFLVPMLAGFLVSKAWKPDLATAVWLLGLIWFLVVALHVLDMPTGPNQCNQCDATEKLTRTFFSIPRPGGLLDDDAPFLATWPFAALLGYSIGAMLAKPKAAQ